jgi:hypothetical protein
LPCKEKQQAGLKVQPVLYYAFDTSLLMNPLSSIVSFFSIACGISMIALAALVQAPPPEDNAKAYQACLKLHPQKYCLLAHLPSKVEAMEKN